MGGGGKGSSPPPPPPPPDPRETGQAQTATNVSTAVANAWLRNPSQITPFGDLIFAEQGQYVWFDPLDKSQGRVSAERAFNQWYAANPPPRLPEPSLKASDPQAYEQQMQAYRDWLRQRNQIIRDLATRHHVNIYSIPMLTAYQALSPGQQEIWNYTEQAKKGLAQTAAEQAEWLREYLQDHSIDLTGVPERQPLNAEVPEFAGAPETPEYAHLFQGNEVPNWDEQRQRIEQAILGRIEPVLQRDEERLRSRLLAQGIQPGTEAWQQAMDDLNRRVNDARLAAIMRGGEEMERGVRTEMAQLAAENALRSQEFSDALRAAAFEDQNKQIAFADALKLMEAQEAQRAAALREKFAERAQPIQEVTSLLHGSAIQLPNFVQPQINAIPVTDYAGIEAENYRNQIARYQAQIQAWQAENAIASQMWGSALGFMGSLFGALSDPREKKDIQKTKIKMGDVPVVTFRYKDEPKDAPKRLGVLASQTEKIAPEAVIETNIKKPKQKKGLRFVDYAALAAKKKKRRARHA